MNVSARHGYSTAGDHRGEAAGDLPGPVQRASEGTVRHYRRLATAAQIAGLLEEHSAEDRALILGEVDVALQLGA